MSIKYQVFQINDFNILSEKLKDLENINASVEITPIYNVEGKITQYFVFSKHIFKKEIKNSPELNYNSNKKLLKFNG